MDDLQDTVVEETLSPEEVAYWDSKGTSDEAKPEQKPEAKAEEPKAEEPKAEEPKVEEKEPEVEKLVKHGAFEEERQRRKKAQQEAQALREELAFIKGQQATLKPEQKPQTLEEIDVEKDPVAAIAALKSEIAARKQAEQTTAQVQSIISTGQRYCQKFAETEPLFFDSIADGKRQQGAYTFLRQATMQRLEQQGVPAHEIEQQVNLSEIRLINDALAQGLDPAVAMWHWAQIAGWKKPEPAKEQNRAEDGKFAKPQPTEAERIAALEKAQKASKSLGSVPSGGGEGPLTLEALADMDDEEFAAATSGKKWDRLHRNGAI